MGNGNIYLYLGQVYIFILYIHIFFLVFPSDFVDTFFARCGGEEFFFERESCYPSFFDEDLRL